MRIAGVLGYMKWVQKGKPDQPRVGVLPVLSVEGGPLREVCHVSREGDSSGVTCLCID
jgi:hypothetical protein